MADRVTSHPKIQPVWNSVPEEITGVAEGAVNGLEVRIGETDAESVLSVKGVFVAIGHMPNTGPFGRHCADDIDEAGYFQAGPRIPGEDPDPRRLCGGRLRDHVYRQAITAAGMGCQAAIEAERWLAEHGG